jgi:hypothetical protein
MLWVPVPRAFVVKVATPPDTVPEPMLVAPSKKVIVPVAAAAVCAVNTTDTP